MPQKYLTVINTIKPVNSIDLIDEFAKAEGEKYIVIKNIQVFNNNGQLDVGMMLCCTFADESIQSCGVMDDFIASTNHLIDKAICIKNTNKRLTFYFKDYKGNMIEEKEGYYYLIEMSLTWSENKNINISIDK